MTDVIQLPFVGKGLQFADQEILSIRAAQSGDLEAFNELVLQYQDLLYRVASRILSDDEMAKDAVQDAFISAFQHIRSFRGLSLRGWLVRIVVNKCFDELGSAHHTRTISLNTGVVSADSDLDDLPEIRDETLPIEISLERSELNHIVQTCLNAMPLNCRSIIVLADIEELSYKEISKILNIPVGTVKSSLSRARLKLRDRLRQHSGFMPERFAYSGDTSTERL